MQLAMLQQCPLSPPPSMVKVKSNTSGELIKQPIPIALREYSRVK